MITFVFCKRKNMVTIISGTNRIGSKTIQVANFYKQVLDEQNIPNQLLSLEKVQSIKRDESIIALENQYLKPADKFIFVMPEYNGGYPGILKLLIDISDIKHVWHHKKAMLTGVADGRAGNLRGLDQLTNVLNYLKINVFHHKIPISKINEETNELGVWQNESTPRIIREQIEGFLEF